MITLQQLQGLVDTIVVVMMENRSFDHMLGFLSHEAFDGRPDIDGLRLPTKDFDLSNPDSAGRLFAPTATPDGYLPTDVPHSRTEVATELRGGAMDGFITTYQASQSLDKSPVPMRFNRPDDIPITASLARNYTVCDHWFASVPADTQPNRMMALSGETLIDSTPGSLTLFKAEHTLLDWLASKKLDFKIYVDARSILDVGPPSNLLLMPSQWGHVLAHAEPLDGLAEPWKSDAPAPKFMYCEPFYNDFATVLGQHGNCNHPPLPVGYGEDFLRRVYETLTSNPKKWARTVLIVCYDEHGGFFDHVAPPHMTYAPPPGNKWTQQVPFATLGVRIPGIVVSSLVAAGSSSHLLFDHTAILQLVVDRFGTPADLGFFGQALARKTNRTNPVQSLGSTLTLSAPRNDILTGLVSPVVHTGAATTPPISELGMLFRQVLAAKPAKRP